MPLGYVLVDRIAREAGIRCLAIKGPILEAQGLREGHRSRDVDVWVDPKRFDDMVAALDERGWRPRYTPRAAGLADPHSVTVCSHGWPTEIDLHHSFPGFLADPAATFEAIWARSVTVPLGGQSILSSSQEASLAIAALHYMRSPSNHAVDLERLAERASEVLTPQATDELTSISREAGAKESSATVRRGTWVHAHR